jgi:hypothetical protein
MFKFRNLAFINRLHNVVLFFSASFCASLHLSQVEMKTVV